MVRVPSLIVQCIAEGEHLGEFVSQRSLEGATKEGDSPVGENNFHAPCYLT